MAVFILSSELYDNRVYTVDKNYCESCYTGHIEYALSKSIVGDKMARINAGKYRHIVTFQRLKQASQNSYGETSTNEKTIGKMLLPLG